jgi:hypothetical protein
LEGLIQKSTSQRIPPQRRRKKQRTACATLAKGRHEKCHFFSVPALLSTPDCLVFGLLDRFHWKFRIGCFELLQTDDVGLRFPKPLEQVRQTAVDAVDIEAGNSHVLVTRVGLRRALATLIQRK